jgi:tetraacyldisaccharide 4'-kinase
MMQRLRKSVETRWYGRAGWLLLLWPLSCLFRLLAALRRRRLQRRQVQLPVPIVIVGNIAVGGTGKTPLLIALTRQLQNAGLKPGVVSRGYGSRTHSQTVQLVTGGNSSEEVGDEPLLIACVTQCPVAVGADRVAAARCLIANGCNIILSDDGLQHYRLARDLEIVVVDGRRGFGNGHCLPTGPLRESVRRLGEVDWVVRNGNHSCPQLKPWSPVPMYLKPLAWVNVKTGERRLLDDTGWLREPAYAVAGIGNPQRFFDSLSDLGLTVFPHAFPDHYAYRQEDFADFAGEVVLMTAKDAVKCRAFAGDHWWYLEVAAELPQSFLDAFIGRVQALMSAEAF